MNRGYVDTRFDHTSLLWESALHALFELGNR
jgi:hypothetical protein